MTRPSRDFTLMDTAFLWAQRSTCSRLAVGCVISRNGRILVQGYNGAPAGLSHCSHSCDCIPEQVLSGYDIIIDVAHEPGCQSSQPCKRAVHAEQSAVAWAAREGVELAGAHASVTHQPCMSCAQSLINAGIVSVDYVEPYRLSEGLHLLTEAGIKINRFVDWASSTVIG